MKPIDLPMLLGVMLCGTIAGRPPAYAQAMGAAIVVEGNDKPWNRGVPIATRQAARELFLEGNRLFKVPLFSRAAEQYAAALSKWKHPAFYFNLALAQLNLGQDVEARDSLEQALQHGEEPLGPEQFKEARKQLHEVESQLGRIQISCQTQGAEVTLDGATLFTGPGRRERWVKTRAHEITAKKPNYLSEARRVMVSAGKRHDIDLRLITLDEAADTGRRWATWKPWTVVAAGAAIAAVGGVLHALSYRNFNAYDSVFSKLDCAKSNGCTEEQIGSNLNTQLIRANQEQKFAIGGYIAGGVTMAGGIVLLYMNRPHLHNEDGQRSPTANIAIFPAVTDNTFALLMTITR